MNPTEPAGDFTLLLQKAEQGDPRAAERILPLVYDELRKLAAARMARESGAQTLQPTALVHEALESSPGTDRLLSPPPKAPAPAATAPAPR